MIAPEDTAFHAALRARREAMLARVESWAAIPSGSSSPAALARMADAFAEASRALLGEEPARLAVPGGAAPVLRLGRRPEAPFRVLLVGHYDTVYDEGHPFAACDRPSPGILRGPGVADMKGGLVLLLEALAAFERASFARAIGWEVLVVPDEEIGTHASRGVLHEAAGRNHLGLVVEPTPVDGALVRARKGSGVFTVTATGRAAHVGRDFASGRNAIVALAGFLAAFAPAANALPGVIANVGSIEGGGVVNVVADRASAEINLRADTPEQAEAVLALARSLLAERSGDGIAFGWEGAFTRPPKPVTPAVRGLLDFVRATSATLGSPIGERDTGGGSDGNLLQASGLTVVDSLGVRGADLHSDREHLVEDSLAERAILLWQLLARLARGERPASLPA